MTETDSGDPVPGRSVTFTFDGAPACSATTDFDGKASCVTTPSAPAGVHTVEATAAADGFFGGATASESFTLVKRPTTITYDGDTTANTTDSATLSATLLDERLNAPLSGRTVTFILGTQSCVGVTDAVGHASCTITINQAPGNPAVIAEFAGDATYVASSDADKFFITKEQSAVDLTVPPVVLIGDPVPMSAGLVDGDSGSPIVGATLVFTLAGETCSGVTDAHGVAACTVTPHEPVGTYPAVVTFDGNVLFTATSDTEPVVIRKRPTTLTYDGATSGDYSDLVSLGATLIDAATGTPVAGAPVTLTLGLQSCSGTTDAGGRATCSITLSQPPGSYTVVATFATSPVYEGSTASEPFTINKEATLLTYDGQVRSYVGQPAALSATLVDSDSGAPIEGRSVTLTFAGNESCTAVTTFTGQASCSVVPSEPAGTHTVTASFAGDDFYTASSDSETYDIDKWPTAVDYNGDTSGFRGHPATMSGVLHDVVPGVPLAGATLTFTLGTQSCSGTTNASGTATCTISPSGGRGATPVTVAYAGSPRYLPSSDTDSFFVLVPTETGRATVVDLTAPILGNKVISDTGAVRTDQTAVKRANLVSLPGPPLAVSVADARVVTQFGTSYAEASVASVEIGLALVPAIKLKAVASASTSSCSKPSSGTSSIGELDHRHDQGPDQDGAERDGRCRAAQDRVQRAEAVHHGRRRARPHRQRGAHHRVGHRPDRVVGYQRHPRLRRPAPRLKPDASRRADCPSACHQWQVEGREQSGGGGAHRGDGVEDPHGGGEQAAIVVVAVRRLHGELERVRRVALDGDAVALALRPMRRDVGVHAGDVLDDEPRLAAHDALDLEAEPGGGALLDRADRRRERLGRRFALVHLADALELDTKPLGHQVDHPTPRRGEDTRQQDERCLVEGAAEAHRVEDDLGLHVGRVVEDLHHPSAVDPAAEPEQREWQQVVGETRIDPGREARRAPSLARGLQPFDGPAVRRPGVHERHDRSRHHVLARFQRETHVGHRFVRAQVAGGGVGHDVGVEGQRGGDVGGGQHAGGGAEPAQLGRVLPRLRVTAHHQTHELKLGVLDDGPQRELPHVAGRPLDHSIRHENTF